MQLSIIEQYKILHDKSNWFKGTAIKGYLDEIGNVIKETGSKTILDYGCGKAVFYREHKIHEKWGVTPILYDPGVPEYMEKPQGKFDGVICADVLEHVENPEEVIAELISHAEKFLFLTISCQHSPPKKKLLDGRPLHISVYPPGWWRERITPPENVRLELRFDVESSK